MSARHLRDRVLKRRVVDIISGDATRPVANGWAMGSFYDEASAAFTPDLEIKEWGGKKYGGATFRREWKDHTHDGNEYVRVIDGTLRIELGEPDARGEIVPFDEIHLAAGESAVLPAGLHRRFEGSDDVLAITVRRGPR
jgi:hypothetical protein